LRKPQQAGTNRVRNQIALACATIALGECRLDAEERDAQQQCRSEAVKTLAHRVVTPVPAIAALTSTSQLRMTLRDRISSSGALMNRKRRPSEDTP
jgi:hypothetical protein